MELRELIPLAHEDIPIIAKIETPQAMGKIVEIIESASVVLVARGDLGVEMDLAQVPLLQKEIARRCQSAGKPVIIATQMLQSMVEAPVATRAEVSDVANAILDNADGVMLSAETSIGEYPVQSVRMLTRIAAHTETYLRECQVTGRIDPAASMRRVTTAVAHSAGLLQRELDAKLVAVWTETGNTARLLSKTRLAVPIIGLSPDDAVCRRMKLYAGVHPLRLDRPRPIMDMVKALDRELIAHGHVIGGDLVLIVVGTRLTSPGATGALICHIVGTNEAESPFVTRRD
jgi:pyruvate kinase